MVADDVSVVQWFDLGNLQRICTRRRTKGRECGVVVGEESPDSVLGVSVETRTEERVEETY